MNTLDIDRLAKAISQMSVRRNYEKDEHIVIQGEEGREMYVIHHGACEARIQNAAGKETVVKKYTRGDIFGELALLSSIGHAHSAPAPRAASVVRLPVPCTTPACAPRQNRNSADPWLHNTPGCDKVDICLVAEFRDAATRWP